MNGVFAHLMAEDTCCRSAPSTRQAVASTEASAGPHQAAAREVLTYIINLHAIAQTAAAGRSSSGNQKELMYVSTYSHTRRTQLNSYAFGAFNCSLEEGYHHVQGIDPSLPPNISQSCSDCCILHKMKSTKCTQYRPKLNNVTVSKSL